MSALVLVRGDTYIEDWVFTSSTQPQPFDLTDCTLRWMVKTSVTQDDDAAEIAYLWEDGGMSNVGITVADATTGRAVLTVTSVDLAALTAGVVYVWDAQLTDADSITTTFASGTLTVTADVTQTVP